MLVIHQQEKQTVYPHLLVCGERGEASHEEVKPWGGDEGCNQANQIIVHVRWIPGVEQHSKFEKLGTTYNTSFKH